MNVALQEFLSISYHNLLKESDPQSQPSPNPRLNSVRLEMGTGKGAGNSRQRCVGPRHPGQAAYQYREDYSNCLPISLP